MLLLVSLLLLLGSLLRNGTQFSSKTSSSVVSASNRLKGHVNVSRRLAGIQVGMLLDLMCLEINVVVKGHKLGVQTRLHRTHVMFTLEMLKQMVVVSEVPRLEVGVASVQLLAHVALFVLVSHMFEQMISVVEPFMAELALGMSGETNLLSQTPLHMVCELLGAVEPSFNGELFLVDKTQMTNLLVMRVSHVILEVLLVVEQRLTDETLVFEQQQRVVLDRLTLKLHMELI